MTPLRHPLVDGVALGVAASFATAFAVGWAVARHFLGPSHPRRHRAALTQGAP